MHIDKVIADLPEDRCDVTLGDGKRCVLARGHSYAHSFVLAVDEEPDFAQEASAAAPETEAPSEEEIPEGMAVCPLCMGGGRVPAELHMAKDAAPCPDCGMIGKVARPTYVQEEIMQTCGTCNGAGWVYKPPPEPQPPAPLPPPQQMTPMA